MNPSSPSETSETSLAVASNTPTEQLPKELKFTIRLNTPEHIGAFLKRAAAAPEKSHTAVAHAEFVRAIVDAPKTCPKPAAAKPAARWKSLALGIAAVAVGAAFYVVHARTTDATARTDELAAQLTAQAKQIEALSLAHADHASKIAATAMVAGETKAAVDKVAAEQKALEADAMITFHDLQDRVRALDGKK